MSPTLSDLIWPALALVLILEGLLPALAPSVWRKLFQDLLRLQDGQIRFFGLMTVCAGALGLFLLR